MRRTESSTRSASITPSSVSVTARPSRSSICSNMFLSHIAGMISRSTPALMVIESMSSAAKLFQMDFISSASETVTPSKPSSSRSRSVMMVLLIVAGM